LWGAIRIHAPMPNINRMVSYDHWRGGTGDDVERWDRW
jgi:hypothetical protein